MSPSRNSPQDLGTKPPSQPTPPHQVRRQHYRQNTPILYARAETNKLVGDSNNVKFVRLVDNINQGCWFNFASGAMFWNTNATVLGYTYYEQWTENDGSADASANDFPDVLPPARFPILIRDAKNLKRLALSDALCKFFVLSLPFDSACARGSALCELLWQFDLNISLSIK